MWSAEESTEMTKNRRYSYVCICVSQLMHFFSTEYWNNNLKRSLMRKFVMALTAEEEKQVCSYQSCNSRCVYGAVLPYIGIIVVIIVIIVIILVVVLVVVCIVLFPVKVMSRCFTISATTYRKYYVTNRLMLLLRSLAVWIESIFKQFRRFSN